MCGAHVWGAEVSVRVPPLLATFFYLFLEQGLSCNPDITISARLARQQAPEDRPDPEHLSPNRDWGYRHVLTCSALTGSRAWTQVLTELPPQPRQSPLLLPCFPIVVLRG